MNNHQSTFNSTSNLIQNNENLRNESLLNRANPPVSPLTLFNYFPNDPSKHIDYVIYYKETPQTQKSQEVRKMRNKFMLQLNREGFDVYTIKRKRDKPANSKSVYLLLNCSLQRLMEEAERVHLELPLKDVFKQFFLIMYDQ